MNFPNKISGITINEPINAGKKRIMDSNEKGNILAINAVKIENPFVDPFLLSLLIISFAFFA